MKKGTYGVVIFDMESKTVIPISGNHPPEEAREEVKKKQALFEQDMEFFPPRADGAPAFQVFIVKPPARGFEPRF